MCCGSPNFVVGFIGLFVDRLGLVVIELWNLSACIADEDSVSHALAGGGGRAP
jgi:hypothetical protein